jgi:hypothetical protein
MIYHHAFRTEARWPMTILAVILAAAVLTCLAFSTLTHKCEEGRYETVHVEAYSDMTFIQIGDPPVLIPVTNDYPARDAQVWRCLCGKPGIAR